MIAQLSVRIAKKLEKFLSPASFRLNIVAHKLDILLTLMTLAELRNSSRFRDEKRLSRFGQKVYSQSDEDGIIEEMIARVGAPTRTFVEIGVGDGLENNTTNLLVRGWKGAWIEGNQKSARMIRRKFRRFLDCGVLRLAEAFVTAENINEILKGLDLHGEVDVLSIDVDGNDYHIFKAIHAINPRLVVIEYNAKFGSTTEWVMAYNPKHVWDETDYFGASLKSLERLLSGKGYALVGCSVSGTNAFFVRNDLTGDKFCTPFTSENHYEPARYWIIKGWASGHRPSFVPFEGH